MINGTEQRGEMQLNIGSSHTAIPGLVNIDIDPRADLVLDLSTEKLPFPDGSVSLVFTHHTLEHIPNYLHAMREIHRVLQHGGLLLAGVPYVTLTEYHQVNPYHLHNFSEHSFAFFDPARLRGSAAEGDTPTFAEVFVRLNYVGRFGKLPRPLRDWCRRHLLNVVRDLDTGQLAVKDPERPLDISPEAVAAAMRTYDQLLSARVARSG